MVPGGGDQPVGDLDVDVVERVGRLVQVVERRRAGTSDADGCATGAQEPGRDPLDRRERLDRHVVGAAGPEPDDDDAAGHRGAHPAGQPVTSVAAVTAAGASAERQHRSADRDRTGRTAGRCRCRRWRSPARRTPRRRAPSGARRRSPAAGFTSVAAVDSDRSAKPGSSSLEHVSAASISWRRSARCRRPRARRRPPRRAPRSGSCCGRVAVRSGPRPGAQR